MLPNGCRPTFTLKCPVNPREGRHIEQLGPVTSGQANHEEKRNSLAYTYLVGQLARLIAVTPDGLLRRATSGSDHRKRVIAVGHVLKLRGSE